MFKPGDRVKRILPHGQAWKEYAGVWAGSILTVKSVSEFGKILFEELEVKTSNSGFRPEYQYFTQVSNPKVLVKDLVD